MKTKIAALMLIVWLSLGSLAPVSPAEKSAKPGFYCYQGVLKRISGYDSFKIKQGMLVFYGEISLLPVLRPEFNRLFPDSVYPVVKPWKNDSLNKKQLAVPVSAKRYSLQKVHTILNGAWYGQQTENAGQKTTTFLFDPPSISAKSGLVKLQNGDYFLLN